MVYAKFNSKNDYQLYKFNDIKLNFGEVYP